MGLLTELLHFLFWAAVVRQEPQEPRQYRRQTLPGRGSCVTGLRCDLRDYGGGEKFSLEDFDFGLGSDRKLSFNF